MHVVANQSGSVRVSPLVMAILVSAAIAGFIVLGSVTGVLPGKRLPAHGDEALTRVESKPAPARSCATCGTIESIRAVELEETVAGGTAEPKSDKGAAAANPNMAMSVLDTLSSAVSGSEAEKNVRKRRVYRVTLRMDDGSFRAISLSSPPEFTIGDKVKVVEGRLVRA